MGLCGLREISPGSDVVILTLPQDCRLVLSFANRGTLPSVARAPADRLPSPVPPAMTSVTPAPIMVDNAVRGSAVSREFLVTLLIL
jgi:hypothetical protein